jgi:tetratricopeptide (TPR) repeat protein
MTGRNKPCPCGSGKKYKRCCLPRERSAPAWPPLPPLVALPSIGTTERYLSFHDGKPVVWELPYDPLDDLSNSVIDLIAAGDLEKAEQVCQRLLAEYPDMIDGLRRTARVAQAKGDLPRAIEFHRKAAHFARTHEWFDPEIPEEYDAEADKLEAQLRREAPLPQD